MKKIIPLLIALLIATVCHAGGLLTQDHNLSRYSSASRDQQIKVIKETLDKAYDKGVLLVPYKTQDDKKDAIGQLKNCVDGIANRFPGQPIGGAIYVCCKQMSYLDLPM